VKKPPPELIAQSKLAAEGPWYVAPARREDGLAEIEDGRQHGLFPVTGEWHEIVFITNLVNWFRDQLEPSS
jgi:hypothetical protein